MTKYKYICEDCGKIFYSIGNKSKNCPNCNSKDLGFILLTEVTNNNEIKGEKQNGC